MSVTDFFAKVRRYDENARVIFDRAEPIGQPTDLVLPHRPWFRRRQRKKTPNDCKSPAKDS